MHDLVLKVGQLKNDIESSITSIYDAPSKSVKTQSKPVPSNEICTLNEKAEAVRQKINEMNGEIISLRQLVNTSSKVGNPNIWRRKIENMESECHNLNSFLHKAYSFRMEKIKTEKDQYELFSGAKKTKPDSESDAVKIQIETRDSLQKSNQRAAEAIEMGHNVLSSLARQDEMLKNVQKRMYSLLNELGISNNFIKLIQKRAKDDMKIFLWLAVLLIAFVIMLLVWVKPLIRSKGFF